MESEIETGSGPVTQNQAARAARPGELEAIVDQTQGDDGPEILTRSATPIPMPNGETAPHADGQDEHESPVSQSIPQMELEVVDQGDKAKTKVPRSKTPTLGDLATGNGNFSANPKIASLQRLYREFLTVQQGAVAAATPTVFQAGEELIALKNTECGKYGKWLSTLTEIGIPQSTAKGWMLLVTRRNNLLSQGKTLPEAYQLLGLTPLGLRKPRKTAISKPAPTLDAALNFLAGWRAKLKKKDSLPRISRSYVVASSTNSMRPGASKFGIS